MFKAFYFTLLVIVGVLPFLTKKRVPGLAFICFILLAIVFAFNTDNNDYEAYYSMYASIRPGQLEYITADAETSPLFSYSMLLFKMLGLSFNFYRLFMFLLVAAVLYLLLNNRIRWELIWAGYGIVIFFFDLVQIRFAFAEFLLLISLFFLVKGKRLLFVALVLLASLFHNMILPFLLFAFVPVYEKSIQVVSKVAPYLVVIILIASIAGKSIIFQLQIIVSMLPIFDEYSNKMEQTVSYGYLLYLIYQTANFVIAKICYNNVSLITEKRYSFQKDFVYFNYMIQIIGFLFVIPAMININFGRYIRVFTVINLCNIGIFSFATTRLLFGRRARLRALLFAAFISLGVLWIIGESYVNGAYPDIVEAVFNSFSQL